MLRGTARQGPARARGAGGRLAAGVVAAAALLAGRAAPAAAQAGDFPPIVDRDVTLDLYAGGALGSLRTVGMGGAALAIAEGSAGAVANPASPAARADTSRGRWDWDWHLDWTSSGAGRDADGNGVDDGDGSVLGQSRATAGAALQRDAWGLAISISQEEQRVEAADAGTTLVPITQVGRVTLARTLLGGDLALGVGLKAGSLVLERRAADGTGELFSVAGASFEAGGLWRPRGRDLRIGAAASLPVAGTDVVVAEGCDPTACGGFVVPERVAVPWQLAAGVAWRRGPSAWNRTVAQRWRDERYLLVAADVVVTGRVTDGHGLEAYARGELQRSGRRTGVSPRAGVEAEWIPGWLRVRGGAYGEPSRFDDADGDPVPGRLHVTSGLDVRLWSFCLWQKRYRLRGSMTLDVAPRYLNGGLSIGLWR